MSMEEKRCTYIYLYHSYILYNTSTLLCTFVKPHLFDDYTGELGENVVFGALPLWGTLRAIRNNCSWRVDVVLPDDCQ